MGPKFLVVLNRVILKKRLPRVTSGISEPETLGKLVSGSQKSHFWKSRLGVGEKKWRTPKIRKRCSWKHTWEKGWVECPFRKVIRRAWTPGGGSRHRGASVKGGIILSPVGNKGGICGEAIY